MTTPLQQIIQDPNRMLAMETIALRSDLKEKKTKELKLFFEKLSNEEWLKTLSREQQTALILKLFRAIPPQTPDKPLKRFFKTIGKFKPPQPKENPTKIIFHENRPFLLEFSRREYCIKYAVETVDEQQLYLYVLYLEMNEKSSEVIEDLLAEELPLRRKIEGHDLLDLGYRLGTPKQFQTILKIYQSKVEESELKEILTEKGKKIITHLKGKKEILKAFENTCEALRLDASSFV